MRLVATTCLGVGLLLVVAGACGDSGDEASAPDQETAAASQDERAESIAEEQFRQGLVETAMALYQHVVWVLMDSKVIADTLSEFGIELVGDVIVGADYPGASQDIWGVEGDVPMSGGQAYVAVVDDNLVVAFRSTDSDDGWEKTLNVLTDTNAIQREIAFVDEGVERAEYYSQLKVHSGFHNEYLRYRDRVLAAVREHPDKNIYVTGHSLGAALAVLASFDIVVHTGRPVALFTFAGPRVGGPEFRQTFNNLVPNSYRVVVNKDPIARVPGLFWPYEHVGRLLQLDTEGVQVPPEEVEVGFSLEIPDFGNHFLDAYLGALEGLRERCSPQGGSRESEVRPSTQESTQASDGGCLNLDWLTEAAESERLRSRTVFTKLAEAVPLWDGIPLDRVPTEKIAVNALSTGRSVKLPRLEQLIPLDKIPIDKIGIDESVLEKLPFGK